MYSFQTLQDFVLNLLNDETARSAYAADPVGALSDAGLGDLTPQDVEEVIPLVTDALPTGALPTDALPTDALTGALPLGALPTDALPLDALPLDALPLDALPTDALPVDLDIDNLADGSGSTGVSALGEVEDLAYAGGLVHHDADGVDLWAGAQSAGRLAGVVQTEGSFVEGGVSTPVVYAGANTNGDYLVTTADPAEALDDLSDYTDTAAGTATHLIGTGAGTLAGAVDTGADTLAGFLAGTPAAPAAGVIETGSDALVGGIATGSGMVSENLANLPSTDDLPVDVPSVDDLPVDLPELPDLEGNVHDGLGNLGDLDLPAQLPDLPVELPDLGLDTSSVTNVVSNSPVADLVSNSPVSGVTDTVTGATDKLPVVGDLTDDLNLGL